ncbi:MAG: hypothetical protein ACM3U1_01050 [Chloroflexota bacterium]
MEDNFNKLVGLRLREARMIFNEGARLSAEQFAYLLSETRDRITNYELGRSALPVRIVYELYRRGISPVYLVSGEGEIFAKNAAGKALKTKISARTAKVVSFAEADAEPGNEFPAIKVSAGRPKDKRSSDQ